MEENTTHPPAPAEKPFDRRIVLVGALALMFIGGYILAFLIPDLIQTVGGPQTLSMQAVADVASDERTYAALEDAEWECDTLREVRGPSSLSIQRVTTIREVTRYTEIFASNPAGDVVALVTLSGEVACSDLSDIRPSGYVYAMENSVRQSLTNQTRLARFINAEAFLDVCGYCGEENSAIGAIFGGVFFLSGVGLLVLYRKLKPSVHKLLSEI